MTCVPGIGTIEAVAKTWDHSQTAGISGPRRPPIDGEPQWRPARREGRPTRSRGHDQDHSPAPSHGIVRDHQEAEDLTRDVFSKLKGSIANYEPRGNLPFSAWIFTVARNAALSHLRRQRSVPVARGIRLAGSAPCLAFTRTVGHSPADHSG